MPVTRGTLSGLDDAQINAVDGETEVVEQVRQAARGHGDCESGFLPEGENGQVVPAIQDPNTHGEPGEGTAVRQGCLLYTSDAADE